MTALSVRLLDKFMREMLLERFVAFYSDVYDGWTEEMLGFSTQRDETVAHKPV